MSPLAAFILIIIGCGYISALPEDETPVVRIVGGQRADIKTLPYQVSLGSNGRHFCGGAIISTKAVLTAAHCTQGRRSNRFTVRAGSSLHASGGQLVRVAKVHNHPNFNRKNLDNDIAVVALASQLTFGPSVKAIPLPSGQIPAGKMGVVSGWGTIGEGKQQSSHLQKVDVNIFADSQCKAIYRSMTANMFCAGFMGGGKDSCQGDSGGPLVNGNTLTGIVSWGRGCARKGFPGVYTNVCRYVSWIKSKL